MEIGTEAAQFPEKEYINGIFVAVWCGWSSKRRHGSTGVMTPPAMCDCRVDGWLFTFCNIQAPAAEAETPRTLSCAAPARAGDTQSVRAEGCKDRPSQ